MKVVTAEVMQQLDRRTIEEAGIPGVVLMENAGRIQTRENLESRLYSWGEEVASNAIEVHIHNLRKKLVPDFIRTVRGVGYTVKKA